MHYSAVIGDGSLWRFNGQVGVAGGLGAPSDVVLSTTGSIELTPTTFESYRTSMKAIGAELSHVFGFDAYQVSDCSDISRFPSIGIQIGGFSAIIPAQEYVYRSSRLPAGHCYIDIVPNRSNSGFLKLGPAFMRNVVVNFDNTRAGFCHRA